MNKYLAHYRVSLQHPGVSGFETLEMLMVRDKLMQQLASLSPDEKLELEAADQFLVAHSTEFYAELSHITNLDYERRQRQTSPTQWWWYLDVLSQLPETPAKYAERLAITA